MPERLPPKPATTAGQFDLFGKRGVAEGPRVYSVSELTREIKGVLEGRFPSVRVQGEVSNVSPSSAGHVYFTLKDEGATLDAVLFRTEARRLKFQVKNGMSLVARGHLDVYEPRGQYKLICDSVEVQGAGALQIAFEQLKEKLQKEGLFAQDRKRRLPFLPRRIAVVTSPSGAAVHDFLRVLHPRFPNLPLFIVPVRVQGEGAAQEIARGIVPAAKQPRVDVVVAARRRERARGEAAQAQGAAAGAASPREIAPAAPRSGAPRGEALRPGPPRAHFAPPALRGHQGPARGARSLESAGPRLQRHFRPARPCGAERRAGGSR